MRWFLEQVFPLILKQRPSCTVAVVGRRPSGAIMELAHRFSGIRVTGTVDDVRPFLWGSLVSIVPIHIGGGTRLKIYEAMAAKVPVVSTTVGAEGLAVVNRENILLADAAQDFAECCLRLLDDAEARRALTGNAWDMVAARFSWESVAGSFADILQNRAS
jgi:glycosyltransferase involved in cell wall biosynthesis